MTPRDSADDRGRQSPSRSGAAATWVAALVAFLAALAALLAVPGAASGGVYPPTPPTIGTDSSVYPPGEDATITIDGFEDCAEVIITINGEIVIVVVSGEDSGAGSNGSTAPGAGSVVVPVPDEPGEYEITATCPETGETTSTMITVSSVTPTVPSTTPVSSTIPGRLPATGGNSTRTVEVGLVLLAAGMTFVLVSRRRDTARVTVRRRR